MTAREMVKTLELQGHSVSYYVRKDGGILITSIDGQRFTGAKGNIKARTMLGTTLSKARSEQLAEATITKKQLKIAPQELKDEWLRVRAIWRKAFPRKKGKKNPVGTLPWKRIRWRYEHYGMADALQSLLEAEKYATGIAYTKNVEELAKFIEITGKKKRSVELIQLSKDIRSNMYLIREEWIKPAYEELYELNHGRSPKTVAWNVRKILRLLNV